MSHLLQYLNRFSSFAGLCNHINDLKYLKIPIKYPFTIIINTRETKNTNNYWVVLFIDNKGTGEYFDPLGGKPRDEIQAFLTIQCPNKVRYATYCHNNLMPSILHCIGYIKEKEETTNLF